MVVVGCPRSGTYLLAQYLQATLGIAMPLETHFIPQFWRWRVLWGDTRDPQRARLLLAAMAAYTRIWLERGTRSRDIPAQRAVSILPELEQLAVSSSGGPLGTLLASVYDAFAERHECAWAGDKSAPFEAVDPADYIAALPDVRVLHIIRDGRDVALSWQSQWFGPGTITEAALAWQRHVQRYQAWGARNRSRYHELRYEDFVADPAAALGAIAAFLHLPGPTAIPAAPRGDLASHLSGEVSHPRIGGALDASSVGRWQREMPRAALGCFEALAGDTLAACNYTRADEPTPGTAYMACLRGGAWLRGHLSVNYVRRRARALLPPALRIVQCLRALRGVDRRGRV